MRPLIGLACACVLLLSGCAHYEYDLTRPANLSGHIGNKSDYIVPRDPLEYRLRSYDNRLVMRIYNPTDDTITLLGQRSSAVDPQGQSHPLRTQTMAPHSFIKLIFPPLRPRLEPTGPTIGIGVGTVIGDAGHRGGWGYSEDIYDRPRYLSVVDDDSLYWQWPGESEVRLILAFERNQSSFTQEFVFARKKQ